MNSPNRILPSRDATPHRWFCLLLVLATISTAQTPATDALTLAKYDTNKNGRLDPGEIAAMEAALRSEDRGRKTEDRGRAETKAPDETIVLSPFEVRSEDRGYYASYTTSGTRLNSMVDDLASSITVVTM